MQTLFRKLKNSFLDENTRIKNATLPYKTALSEANVKAIKMRSTNWTYANDGFFSSDNFIFSKILF